MIFSFFSLLEKKKNCIVRKELKGEDESICIPNPGSFCFATFLRADTTELATILTFGWAIAISPTCMSCLPDRARS
jgi:hypothetical protein